MSAGKILNASHALYNNITRALSGDKFLAKLVALDGGVDTATQPEHQANTHDVVGATSWTAVQGICRDAANWFAINTADLKKYDLTGTQVASNATPFAGLPAGVDHCGAGFIDGGYLYTPVTNYANEAATIVVIAKYNISDLSLHSYFDVSAQTALNGSAVALSPDGTEIYVTSFTFVTTPDPRNTDIYRFSKADGSFLGVLQLSEPCVGIQSLQYHPIMKAWLLGSFDNPNSLNTIHLTDENFVYQDKVNPIFSNAEMEGVTYYNGDVFFHEINGSPRLLELDNVYISRALAASSPVKFLDNTLITESNTLLFRARVQKALNYTAFFDSLDAPNGADGNDWECWAQTDLGFHFRIDNNARVSYSPIVENQEYIFAFTWEKVGANVTIKLGVNGSYVDTNSTGVWLPPPTDGLWLAGINPLNDQGGNVYNDIIVVNKVLSDAELLDASNNFSSFYVAEGTAPIGTTTVDSVTPTTTTCAVAYSYNNTDETGYKYRLNGGAAVDIGTTNPFTITGLTANTAYTVEVLAYNATGDGVYSSPITNFSTLQITSTISITNTDTPDGIHSTEVYNTVTKTGYTEDVTFSGGSASITATNVPVGTKMWYMIEGSNPPATGVADVEVTV